MRLIHTSDGEHYRRWVNLIPSFLLPGSAQFLSGRRAAGVTWWSLSLVYNVLMFGYLIHPRSPYTIDAMGPFEWITFLLSLVIVADGFRRPMRRLRFKGWLLCACVCLGIVVVPLLSIRAWLVHPFKIPTGAMQPTIMGDRKDARGNQISGDRIFVNKLIYRFSAPQRGDVVVFRTDGIQSTLVKPGTVYVKRLVGLPGETIRIDPPYVLVNDRRLTKPAIFRKIAEGKHGYGGYGLAISNAFVAAYLTTPADKMTLGPDEYLVMGDDTRRSLDGRFFGPIKRSAIIGKAFYIYAPANRKRRIE
jgi:signal peptidase I